MPKDDIRLTCPICLGAQDPEDMVTATVERAFPPGPTKVQICRRCATAIAKAVKDTGDLPPSEVTDEPSNPA